MYRWQGVLGSPKPTFQWLQNGSLNGSQGAIDAVQFQHTYPSRSFEKGCLVAGAAHGYLGPLDTEWL